MRKILFAVIGAAALTGFAVGAPAQVLAAPSGAGAHALEGSGYQVEVNSAGDTPLDHCTVDSLRPGGALAGTLNEVKLRPVFLTANC